MYKQACEYDITVYLGMHRFVIGGSYVICFCFTNYVIWIYNLQLFKLMKKSIGRRDIISSIFIFKKCFFENVSLRKLQFRWQNMFVEKTFRWKWKPFWKVEIENHFEWKKHFDVRWRMKMKEQMWFVVDISRWGC